VTPPSRGERADLTSDEALWPWLVLLRHARASTSEWSDAARHLSPDGRLQAEVTGRRLGRDGMVPDVVVCSSAARTRETWSAIAAVMEASPQVIYSEELYRGYVPELVESLHGIGARAKRVMVVGHNPTVSAAAAYLAAPGSDPEASLRVHRGLATSSYAVLRPLLAWSEMGPGTAVLATVVKPRV
jgi:phosphohistidine phosphatase